MDKARIVIVDDDSKVVESVRSLLEAVGYSVRAARNAEQALEIVEAFSPDLVILDIVLPEEFLGTGERADGLTVLRKIRRDSQVAVLMLSSSSLASLKVLALDLGADDYLTKPFDARELVARVKAILRRRGDEGDVGFVFEGGGLRIEGDTRRVWRDGLELQLTPLEFELLLTLARRPEHVITRAQLIRSAWKDAYYGDERVVDTHIASLRKKIESNPMKPEVIVTIRGSGYRFGG